MPVPTSRQGVSTPKMPPPGAGCSGEAAQIVCWESVAATEVAAGVLVAGGAGGDGNGILIGRRLLEVGHRQTVDALSRCRNRVQDVGLELGRREGQEAAGTRKDVAETFKVAEEEDLVLDDRTADVGRPLIGYGVRRHVAAGRSPLRRAR